MNTILKVVAVFFLILVNIVLATRKELIQTATEVTVFKPLKFLIYTPLRYVDTSGGIVALHHLAKILDELGHDVKMYFPNATRFDSHEKSLFGKYTNKRDKNVIAIYSEGMTGNSIYAKIVVRWILAGLGTFKEAGDYANVIKSWKNRDLVYHFWLNGVNNNKYDKVYKQLSPLYVSPLFTPPEHFNEYEKYSVKNRPLVAYFMHKGLLFHPEGINFCHPPSATSLDSLFQKDFISVLQKSHTFYCYDPQSFMAQISVLCGCVAVIYPIPNLTEAEYWATTVYGTYFRERKNVSSFYGIAYGQEGIPEARRTIHLAKQEIEDIVEFYKQTVYQFVDDMRAYIANPSSLSNTVKNSKYKNMVW